MLLSPLTASADGVFSYNAGEVDTYGLLNIPVGAKTGVVGLANGYYCQTALKSDGSVIAWGHPGTAQLSIPADLGPVKSIASGAFATIATLADGSFRMWGSGDSAMFNIPQTAKSGVASISVGFDHILALKSDGSVVAWGNNYSGQCTIPADALQGVVDVRAGTQYSLALKTNGTVVAWGTGSGSYGFSSMPSDAQSGIVSIAAGYDIAYAVKANGTVVRWGNTLIPDEALPGIQGSIKAVLAEYGTSRYSGFYVKNDNTLVSTASAGWLPLTSFADYTLIKPGSLGGAISAITKTNLPSYGDLEYQNRGSSITIWGYHGKGGDVTIPRTIEGLPVTAIADYAFASFHFITGIHFPDTLQSIGSQAFDDCTGLDSVSIPDNVITMGINAFSGCENLVSVRLPLFFTGDITALGLTGNGAASALLGSMAEHLPSDTTFANWVSSVTKQEILTSGVLTHDALSAALGGYATLDQISTLATKTELETLRSTVTTLQTDLTSTTNKLTASEQKLTSTQQDLSQTKTTLTSTQQDLSQTKTTLTSTQQDLSQTKTALTSTQQDLSQTKTALTSTQQDLSATKTALAANSTELTKTREDLQKLIAGLAKDPEFLRTLAEQITAGTNNYGMVVKQNQTLNFPAIPAVTYAANKTLKLAATSSAGLTPVNYSSSDPEVASIIGNVVTLNKAGTVEITATQPGTNLVSPASTSQTLTVNRITQTLKLTSIPAQSYVAGKQIALKATSSAKLTPILFSSSDPAVASIDGSTLTLQGPGTTIITATQAGNDTYRDASASFTLILK